MAESNHRNGNGGIGRDQIMTGCTVLGLVAMIGGPLMSSTFLSMKREVEHERELRLADARYAELDRRRIAESSASVADIDRLNERVGQKFTEVETQIDAIEQRQNSNFEQIFRLLNAERRDSEHDPFDMPQFFSSIAERNEAKTNGRH